MSIVLKENDWAEEMIRNGDIGKKPTETLTRVARYYIDKGYSKKDIRRFMESFLIRCDSKMSVVKWSGLIEYTISKAKKYKAIDIDGVDVTKPEMDVINSLNGKQIRRLAFTLLCLSKYWKIVTSGDDYWVNNRDNEIMAMANINTSIRRQSSMYWELNENGMIRFSKKVDNTNVCVCFASDGDVVMHITDFRNLGYQYLKYCGESYFECQNCGIVTKENNPGKGRHQKYCKECAVSISTQQRVNSVMKQRMTKLEIVDKNEA